MDTLGLWPAFIAGLAASGHCASMCGGVAGALSLRNGQASAGTKFAHGLAYNLARIGSYAAAGALIGVLGHLVLHAFDVGLLSVAFRVFAGAIMIAVAGRLLFGWRLLDPLEAAGSALWRRTLPWANRRGRSAQGIGGAIGLGLAWGWLPCGLSYSMLLLAATTASATAGALVMAAFGVGTLPAMVTATVAFERAARALATRASLRKVAGVLLVAFGAWTAGNALYHALARGGHAGHSMPAQGPAQPETAHDDPHAHHQHPQ
jgi:sulfite exporter TauE/SafE